ncbi:MAG: hypothetical protein J5I93_28280, partial [Pirellulaceae bacterium]|nr:hypothetical protein [Pirellulaceae bacterium]
MASEANHDSHLQLSLEAAVTAGGDPAWSGVAHDTASAAARLEAGPLPFFDLQSAEPLPAEPGTTAAQRPAAGGGLPLAAGEPVGAGP